MTAPLGTVPGRPDPDPPRPELLELVRAAQVRSGELSERTARAVAHSRDVRAVSSACAETAVVVRLRAGDFRLRGLVDGAPVVAVWVRGRLQASPALLAQAATVVALGDRLGDGSPAGLRTARSALLTLVRACDRVLEVDLGTAPERRGVAAP